MKPTTILLIAVCLHASTIGFAQRVTLSEKNTPLQQVFTKIEKQTGYMFTYAESLLAKAKPVTIALKDTDLQQALAQCLNNQPFTYTIIEKTVVVKLKPVEPQQDPPPMDVHGRIVNENAEPVAGATVAVKGAAHVTVTSQSGEFVLHNIDGKATLIISGANIETYELEVNSRADITITVTKKVNDLDEAVVVAYGKTTQRTSTAAVTVVKGEEIQNLPSRSFDKNLQGLVPGLLVTSGTGQPGGGVSNFVLRGIATASADALNGGSVRNPLIVIDGIPVTQDYFQLYNDIGHTPISNPMAQLNPSEMESITVLKDASAIALYGSRASNGVIVIKTKRGKQGRPVFNFRHHTDIATQLNGKIKTLNQQQQMQLITEAYRNYDSVTYPDETSVLAEIKKQFPLRADGSFYPETNWDKVLLNTHALTVSNELSVSGGSARDNYYINLEYSSQNGIEKKTGYDRTSIRINYENRLLNWLKIGLNAALSYNVQDYGTVRATEGNIGKSMSTFNPVRYEDGTLINIFNAGSLFSGKFSNPAAEQAYNFNRNTAYRGISKIFAEVNIGKGLKFTTNLGTDFMLTEAREKTDPRLIDAGLNYETGGRIEQLSTRRANIITTNLLNYDKSWKAHTIGLLAGQEAQILSQNAIAVAVRGLSSPVYEQINSPGVSIQRYSGNQTKETLQSFFGQLNYGYSQKYFLSASVRRDGSSRFGEDKRYGTYWSAGAGWIICSEQFFRPVLPVLNYLKLRGSIGEAGNAGAINKGTRYDALQPAIFQGGPAVYPYQYPGNPDVKWENTFSWDAAVEMQFFDNRVQLVADWYERRTTDLIYSMPLAGYTGYYSVLGNVGTMNNKGLELVMTARLIRQPTWRLSINANWSRNKNILVKANAGTASSATTLLYNQEGQPFNSFYLRKWAGVDPATGNAQWMDSTGKPNTNYRAAKQEFVGSPLPDGFGSATILVGYKGFDLSAQFYYQYGNMIYQANKLVNDGSNPYMNQDVRALDHWTKPGDVAANPKPVLHNSTVNRSSTRYLYKGDYIRLQNLLLSYNFPNALLKRLHIQSLKMYTQGSNLFTWMPFDGSDPANVNIAGSAGYLYPTQKNYSIGLNIGL